MWAFCYFFRGIYRVKFGNFVNFTGKYHVKFGHHFVNFSCTYFRAKMSFPKLTELLYAYRHASTFQKCNHNPFITLGDILFLGNDHTHAHTHARTHARTHAPDYLISAAGSAADNERILMSIGSHVGLQSISRTSSAVMALNE